MLFINLEPPDNKNDLLFLSPYMRILCSKVLDLLHLLKTEYRILKISEFSNI